MFIMETEGGYDVKRHFQQYFRYIVSISFYWWRKLEYSEKTTDLLQVTDKLCHIMLYEYTSHERNSNSQH